jgi:hypothetical protein
LERRYGRVVKSGNGRGIKWKLSETIERIALVDNSGIDSHQLRVKS